MNEKIQAFLKEIGFAPTREDRVAVMHAFEREADAAIAGAPSSLRMIDSCLPFSSVAPATSAPVIVVDAGGTNLRVAAVRFTAGGPQFSHLHRSRMPGTDGAVSADAFHAAIAAEVDAVRALEPAAAGIGYCFSYECRSLPDGDAELVAWSKQVSAPEVIGQRVGAELVRRLAGGPLPVVVLNDTVATLLAGLSCRGQECPGQIGFILGTGTNVACVEKGTVRNAESGECDKMPRSPCDVAYDATLPDTGAAPFEKMVSGAYLGGVGHELLKAAARAGLIDGSGLDGLSLSTRELDAFGAGAGDVSSPHPLAAALAPRDVPAAREIVRAVFLRAVSLTAAHLAAFVRRSAEAGRSPVRITADGSTYWKTRTVDFDGLVRREIAELVPDVPFEIVHIDEAPMVGAACGVATLAGRVRERRTA